MSYITVEEIMRRYHLKKSTFYNRRRECLLNPKFKDAILLDGRQTLIEEDLWDKFMRDRSERQRKRLLNL